MSRLSRVESLEETSFSNSIERSVGAADATLQHLASAKETFGDLEAAYRTFKHELEIVKTEHATQVRKSLHSVLNCKRSRPNKPCLFPVLHNRLEIAVSYWPIWVSATCYPTV